MNNKGGELQKLLNLTYTEDSFNDSGIHIKETGRVQSRNQKNGLVKRKFGEIGNKGRSQNVNEAFNSLRERIPTDPVNRKLSKIEILRLAQRYIIHLMNCLKVTDFDRMESPCHSNSNQESSLNICTFCKAQNNNHNINKMHNLIKQNREEFHDAKRLKII
ncbi:hypothetical protein SNEBB_008313 [Seison nebaliae]|nr:hypothetical protein SNEBB_008313 [Seison nebaliae]